VNTYIHRTEETAIPVERGRKKGKRGTVKNRGRPAESSCKSETAGKRSHPVCSQLNPGRSEDRDAIDSDDDQKEIPDIQTSTEEEKRSRPRTGSTTENEKEGEDGGALFLPPGGDRPEEPRSRALNSGQAETGRSKKQMRPRRGGGGAPSGERRQTQGPYDPEEGKEESPSDRWTNSVTGKEGNNSVGEERLLKLY